MNSQLTLYHKGAGLRKRGTWPAKGGSVKDYIILELFLGFAF